MAAMVGRYAIASCLGEGAMAEVYRAQDTSIGRAVAIKALKPEFRRDPEIAERFVREARAAGILSHPNIATIYDVGEADGVTYIAMELVEGQPLDTVIATHGRMAPERVLKLAMQLADALGHAHKLGIVHRDVKPSNIIVSADGACVKLLDFGVARVGEHDPHLGRTQVGQVIGTPRYMSPEQALGLPVDARADLFSLGVVLYEMVTGQTAFAGTSLATLAIQVAQQPPRPIDQLVRDCPKGLRFIVERLLAKKPEQRFADGEALRQAIARELAVEDEPVRRRGLALRVKLPLALAATTALALGYAVAVALDRQHTALERMALTSGGSITAFVAKNAAVLAADNAGLPATQQDWAPLQAFVDSAARDADVTSLVVVDDRGWVRAASDRTLIRRRYVAPAADQVALADGYRFARPLRYAGADFGRVDLVLKRDGLDAALASTRNAMLALAGIVMVAVLLVGWLSGALIARPLRRLRKALDDMAGGDLAFRLDHRRRDEIGQAFDAFNRAAAALEPRLTAPELLREAERAATATIVAPRKAA